MAGSITLPPPTGALSALWDVVLVVPPRRWALIGGQMVTLHALHANRTPLRVSRDVDVLADLLTARDGLTLCVSAIRGLDLLPEEGPSGHVHRFTRARDTIQITGGRQALERAVVITVTKDARSAAVPVPDLLGARDPHHLDRSGRPGGEPHQPRTYTPARIELRPLSPHEYPTCGTLALLHD